MVRPTTSYGAQMFAQAMCKICCSFELTWHLVESRASSYEYLTFNRTICTSCTCESVGESASFRLPRIFVHSSFAPNLAKAGRSVQRSHSPAFREALPVKCFDNGNDAVPPPRLSTKCRPKLHSMPRRAWRTIWSKVEQAARARASFRESGVGASSSRIIAAFPQHI